MMSATPHSTRSVVLTVAEVIDETADATSLVFDVPDESRRHFVDYRPGQFLTVRIPSDRTGSVARCYSLASSPLTDARPKVTVKRTSAGYGSNWLCDNIIAGSTVEALPPAGVFTPDDLDAPLVLVAAGSGITPVISILKAALHRGSAPVALLYANRGAQDVIYADEIDALAAGHRERLSVAHWWESERGLPTAAGLATMLADIAPDAASSGEVFLCGPGPFMDVARTALRDIGFGRERVHVEVFTSLSGDPFDDPDLPDPRLVESPGADPDVASVSVGLDGAVHELAWPRDKNLVEVMLAAGLDAPYSCREGECGSCACTVVDGTVEMANVGALDDEDIADGYILGCQARPTSDHLTIEF